MNYPLSFWAKLAWWGGGLVLVILLSLWVLFHTSSILLMSIMLGILASVVVAAMAMPLTHWLSLPWGSLYYSKDYSSKPAPMYDTAAAQVKRGHYTEAMALYEEIIRDDPGEVKAYISIIDMAIVHLHDPGLASYVYQRGLAALKKQEARETLTRMYTGISSRLAAKPEWQQRHPVSMEGHPLNPFPLGASERDVPAAPR